jgi:PmbA protein
VASSLVGHLIGAVLGSSIARGTSFLKDQLGQQIFPAAISIIDDPFRRRGLGSRPVDGEGLSGATRAVVRDGVLATWLLDLRSARQLGLTSTGNAARGLSGPPGPSSTNVHLTPGAVSRDQLIGGIKNGLYVTELIGMGVNPVNGDYSRGASGLWIENGEFSHPVSEITIAGNLKTMFAGLVAADDLEFRTTVNAPTCLVESMTIAGA